ncbi:hypothetical protein JQ626_31040 [Bradyrhizobium diazoefficiens]|nr:hypothetical protein [Bradyrhizobium diazoefficiens]MBR0968503.1 hypothetical protein [Bradyrhizobium diazoefficiens]MBR1011278.1 hypothetical protein [Bradyrhizobium diazoefficiens]MBR1015745.1 hypothetical protein [Bradyrhizobium diazoefficiens]MBR1061649.1 hypothetical protein [Bradyrhizobium diazoefficiens]MBR1112904.1 hypothetical protein [Bradyrhizobium diazoefficiens]
MNTRRDLLENLADAAESSTPAAGLYGKVYRDEDELPARYWPDIQRWHATCWQYDDRGPAQLYRHYMIGIVFQATETRTELGLRVPKALQLVRTASERQFLEELRAVNEELWTFQKQRFPYGYDQSLIDEIAAGAIIATRTIFSERLRAGWPIDLGELVYDAYFNPSVRPIAASLPPWV